MRSRHQIEMDQKQQLKEASKIYYLTNIVVIFAIIHGDTVFKILNNFKKQNLLRVRFVINLKN